MSVQENKATKLTFNEIDKAFDGQISGIIGDMEYIASKHGWDEGYIRGKGIIERFVGWHCTQCENIPELKTQKAYDIVLEKLAEACYRGGGLYEARLKADRDLELQGIYRDSKAEDMSCVRDWTRQCTPQSCMAWRWVDDEHGYCAFMGCSKPRTAG